MDFNKVWCTVDHQLWAEVALAWTRVLWKREENDVGWVPNTDSPIWNPKVAVLTGDLSMSSSSHERSDTYENQSCSLIESAKVIVSVTEASISKAAQHEPWT